MYQNLRRSAIQSILVVAPCWVLYGIAMTSQLAAAEPLEGLGPAAVPATLDADVAVVLARNCVECHNAVDAIAGRMWLEGLEGGDKIFYTTGRLTSEMVIKTAQMGIPFLVSRSGLTQMGYDLARRVGMTMIGRAQGRHYLLFTGAERFAGSATPVA